MPLLVFSPTRKSLFVGHKTNKGRLFIPVGVQENGKRGVKEITLTPQLQFGHL